MGPGRLAKYPPLRVGDFKQLSNASDWNKDGPIGQVRPAS
jgi:hypothetical protein